MNWWIAREGADRRVILDLDVAGQGGGVGEDRLRTHMTVVSDVDIGHEQTVVADRGQTTAPRGSSMDRHELAKGVAVADLEVGLLARILEILWWRADGTMALEAVARSDGRPAGDPAVGADAAVFADGDMSIDDRIWLDHDAVGEFGLGVDDRGWVNFGRHHRSISADIMSASHAT